MTPPANRLPIACRLLLVPSLLLYAFGMVRLHYNLSAFAWWIREDGLVEWATFGLLVAMGLLALMRASSVGRPGRAAWLALGLWLLFCAAEEISWGQRVLGWHSPDWFVRHNLQGETNLHNLEVAGLNVNKLVFGKLLGAALGLYFLALPTFYRRSPRVREFFDARRLPLPRLHQTVLMLAAWLPVELSREEYGKAGELLEFAGAVLLLLVLLHPRNLAAELPSARRLEELLQALRDRMGRALQTWLTPRLRFLLLATALLVLEFGAFRLIFAAAFEPPGLVGPVGEFVKDRGIITLQVTGTGLAAAADVVHAWVLGLRFDLRIALLALLPFAVLGGVRRLDPARGARARRGWLAYLAATLAGVLALHAIDLGQYAYEAERLNMSLLDHLREARLAAGMAWQTYPVLGILAGVGLLTVATTWQLARWLPVDPAAALPPRGRRRAIAAAAAMLYVLGVHGQWSQYPLRWSNAYFTPNAYVTALASNPLQTLFDSWRAPLALGDPVAACAAGTLLAPHYGLDPCTTPPASFGRRVEPPAARHPNVVIVFLESFSAFKTGVMGNPLEPTPHFDALARSSLLFTRYYSVTRPTARSIFSTLFGIPDVNPVLSASRNPRLVRQHTLVNAFTEYRKHYFIGGSASWGNIRGMLAHNVADLHLHEGEYSGLPGNDVWGASDLHLFEQAHRVLATERQPFLAFIQTAGNHRPYTIPDDARGFTRTAPPATALAAAGFEEPAAYDGMRFMDHALGHFLELARAAPYYENTIFAFFGDHGSPARRFPPHEQELRRLHTPLVLHGPRWLGAPRVIGTPASSIDVLPTLTTLAGMPHVNTALGRDLLAPLDPTSRFAFLTYGPFRGLVDAEYFYARDPSGRETLHRLRPDGSLNAADLAVQDPQRLQAMAQTARAMHDSAGWLLVHNPPLPGESRPAGR